MERGNDEEKGRMKREEWRLRDGRKVFRQIEMQKHKNENKRTKEKENVIEQ